MLDAIDHSTMTVLSRDKDKQKTVANEGFSAALERYRSSLPSDDERRVLSRQTVADMDDRHITVDTALSFAKTLIAAQAVGAENRPKDFLRALEQSELDALQLVHGLKSPINIDALDEEGARNLLVQPHDAEDINKDGLIATGEMLSWQFPPAGASESVKQAWKESVANHTLLEHTLKVGPFLAREANANVQYDVKGNPVGVYHQADDGFTQIYGQDKNSYLETANSFLSILNKNDPSNTKELSSERESFLADFARRLENA